MTTKAKVVNRLPEFGRVSKNVLSDALDEAAKDVLIDARNRAPFRKGALRRESVMSVVSTHKRRVSFWVEYARFQEFGGDGRRRVRNYTTPGTGAHFLQNAGEKAVANFARTLAKHAARARI
jgi:hypothetical protein